MNGEDISAFRELLQRSSPDDRENLLAKVVSTSPRDLSGLHLLCSLNSVDKGAFSKAMRKCILYDNHNILALQSLLWASRRELRMEEARDCIFRMLSIEPKNEHLWLDLLRSELVQPGPIADANIKLCLEKISDPLTRASYGFQLGCRFSHWAHVSQREILLSLMAGVAERHVGSHAVLPAQVYGSTQDAWAHILSLLTSAHSLAIVGNGPSVLGKGFGARIDAQDIVIRINFPSIRDYTIDVGQRTDLVVFSEGLFDRLDAFLERDVSYRTAPLLSTAVPSPRSMRSARDLLSVLNIACLPDSLRRDLHNFSYDVPTTGCLILCMCIIIGVPNINLYGFDFYKDERKPHYFPGHDQTFLGHDVAYERLLIEGALPKVFQRT